MQSNPAKLNPRCWNCDRPMSHTMRSMTVFCSPKCEREYNSTEQGYTLIPVLALITAFTVAAVIVAQSGLLRYVVARLAAIL
jgi:hypothetical protein